MSVDERRRHVVIVDSREPWIVKAGMQALLPSEIEEIALPEGDFMLPDQDSCLLGIERKTVGDFISSLKDGRLAAQLTRMSGSYTVQGLIVEGRYDVDGAGFIQVNEHHTRWGHTSFQMSLWSLQRHFPGLVVWWTNEIGESLDIVRGMANRGYKGCFSDTTLLVGVTRSEGTTRVRPNVSRRAPGGARSDTQRNRPRHNITSPAG